MTQLVTAYQLAQAAFMAGQGYTAKQIADHVGVPDIRALRQLLNNHGIELLAKPAGYRPVTAYLSPAQIGVIAKASRSRGICGGRPEQVVAERALRILGDDVTLLDNVLSDGVNTDG